MSRLLATCPGRVYTFSQGNGGGSGLFKLRPDINVTGGGKLILQGPTSGGREIVQTEVTLDGEKILYTYGSGWGDVAVRGRILLGDSSSARANIGKIEDYFKTNRVSALQNSISLSMGNEALELFLVNHSIGNVDPVFHYLDFSLICKTTLDD